MELGQFLRVAYALSAAIGRMHATGLIHKDIKPGNVLVNMSTCEVWLTGFGIATRVQRALQSPVPPEVISGTFAYMAPEQTGRMNRSIDARSERRTWVERPGRSRDCARAGRYWYTQTGHLCDWRWLSSVLHSKSLFRGAAAAAGLVYIVPCNGEYATLKRFAELEHTPDVPALDLPGLDILATAKGFGCRAVEARTRAEIQRALESALEAEGPTVICIPIRRDHRALMAQH
jgi:serine/threonine protein kinase